MFVRLIGNILPGLSFIGSVVWIRVLIVLTTRRIVSFYLTCRRAFSKFQESLRFSELVSWRERAIVSFLPNTASLNRMDIFRTKSKSQKVIFNLSTNNRRTFLHQTFHICTRDETFLSRVSDALLFTSWNLQFFKFCNNLLAILFFFPLISLFRHHLGYRSSTSVWN